jgi:hypothetical protein
VTELQSHNSSSLLQFKNLEWKKWSWKWKLTLLVAEIFNFSVRNITCHRQQVGVWPHTRWILNNLKFWIKLGENIRKPVRSTVCSTSPGQHIQVFFLGVFPWWSIHAIKFDAAQEIILIFYTTEDRSIVAGSNWYKLTATYINLYRMEKGLQLPANGTQAVFFSFLPYKN